MITGPHSFAFISFNTGGGTTPTTYSPPSGDNVNFSVSDNYTAPNGDNVNFSVSGSSN